MKTTTLSCREFEKDPKRARKATAHGPVFINEHGRLAYVLLTIEEYRRIGGTAEPIPDLLAMPEAADIDFDPPRMGNELIGPVDFS
jgi:PHD/YefM family antitoxin component YafN of YafNO toxin-antitoxin module